MTSRFDGDLAAALAYKLDAELAAGLSYIADLDFNDIPAARVLEAEIMALTPAVDTTGASVRNVDIPVDGGRNTVTLRLTTPIDADRPMPVIYNVHGGGFCCGTVEAEHARDVELANEVGAIVATIAYRLAPEHPYPTGLEDCYAGLVWVARHADEIDADVDRIAVRGRSAGGGLAAALTLLTRDRGGPKICYQFLCVPELDDRLDTPSMKRFVDTPRWNLPKAVLSWKYYLGDLAEPGSADVPIYAAPARETNFAGLPPAYISVMQFDPLRDEGIRYAQALLDADVIVELHLYPATFHASHIITAAEVSQRELAEEAAVLFRALHG
ncbi:alpha/beta hydrolase [Mycobacterium sp. 21AC1]|uniref:alpha/beta hydrolase n=1 Tax=[Mycobacterium] appelbergii TaxID=2939269 RepID=UPI0029394A07|nr:alpha/beta hydrolase [Mycobacterium sp. 21AC1]MDV3128444.1 alpha/beta hydrolase [Mycobacterium sp. 21AC1]